MTLSTRILFMSVFFVAATMTANIMSLRMVAPLGIAMDAGTLLYPVTFVLRDALHRRGGLGIADKTVTASAVCNIAMFSLIAFTAWLPYDPITGTQEAFGAVLLPSALIVIGSITGQFVGEMIDGRIFHRIYRNGDGSLAKAALVSNVISIPIDTIIVCCIAFGFTVPMEALISTIAVNIAIKYIVMVVMVALYGVAPNKKQ